MTVELDFSFGEDGIAMAQNYPEDNGWCIDIFLKKLRARKNSNMETLANKINQLYLREFLCIKIQELVGEMPEEEYEKIFCHNPDAYGCVTKNILRYMQ